MLKVGIYLLAETTEASRLMSLVGTELCYRWDEQLLAS